jgi:phosphatidylinositol alpha-1,6-mannosyltransferase
MADRRVGLSVQVEPEAIGGIEVLTQQMLAATAEGIDWTTVKVPRMDRGLGDYLRACLVAFRKARMARPTIVLIDRLHAAGPGIAARLGAGWSNTSAVMLLHGTEVASRSKRSLKKMALRASSMGVANSQWTASQAKKLSRNLPVTVVHPGVDSDWWHPPADLNVYRLRDELGLQCDFLLLSVCRLARNARHKGLDRICQALPLLSPGGPRLHWAIVGDGDDAEWLDQNIDAAGIRDCVSRFANLSPENLRRLFWAGSLFVLPSMPVTRSVRHFEAEGFGIVFIEAAAAGLPVLATSFSGSADAVLPRASGMFCDGSIADIARRIDDVRLDRVVFDRQKAIEWGREHDWARQAQRWMAAFDNATRH